MANQDSTFKIQHSRFPWPTLLVLAVIIYATWLPHPLGDDDLPAIPHLDKLIHAIMMGGINAAILFDYRRCHIPFRPLTPRIIILSTVAAMAFGLVDETVQNLLPIDRPFDPYDLLANWFGAIVAAFAAPPAIRAVLK